MNLGIAERHLRCGSRSLFARLGFVVPQVSESRPGSPAKYVSFAFWRPCENVASAAAERVFLSSKYPPAKPEALWLVAPQRGLCRSTLCR